MSLLSKTWSQGSDPKDRMTAEELARLLAQTTTQKADATRTPSKPRSVWRAEPENDWATLLNQLVNPVEQGKMFAQALNQTIDDMVSDVRAGNERAADHLFKNLAITAMSAPVMPKIAGAGRLAKAFRTAQNPRQTQSFLKNLQQAQQIATQTAPAVQAAAPRIINPATGNVFSEAGLGKNIPSYVTGDLAPRNYSQKADLSMITPIQLRARDFDRNVERGLRENPESLGWYDLSEMRKGFENLSQTGIEDFNQFSRFMGPPSSGMTVPQNVRMASYYYYLWKNGLLTPEILAGKMAIPSGYAHPYQKGVNSNLKAILEQGDLNPFRQPKVYRYSGALQGRWGGIPLDRHVGRQIGLPGMLKDKNDNLIPDVGFPTPSYWETNLIGTSPVNTHYPDIEDMLIRQADRKGILPAPYMAAGWVGGARQTGVEDARTLLAILNEKFRTTGQRYGVSPTQAFEGFALGKHPLY